MPSMRSALALSALLAVMPFSTPALAAEQAHFHHLHMNVADIARTTKFYQQMFGVAAVQYDNRTPALMMERSFLFLNRMDADKIGNHQMDGAHARMLGDRRRPAHLPVAQEQGRRVLHAHRRVHAGHDVHVSLRARSRSDRDVRRRASSPLQPRAPGREGHEQRQADGGVVPALIAFEKPVVATPISQSSRSTEYCSRSFRSASASRHARTTERCGTPRARSSITSRSRSATCPLLTNASASKASRSCGPWRAMRNTASATSSCGPPTACSSSWSRQSPGRTRLRER